VLACKLVDSPKVNRQMVIYSIFLGWRSLLPSSSSSSSFLFENQSTELEQECECGTMKQIICLTLHVGMDDWSVKGISEKKCGEQLVKMKV
jgi:hypothetical protein